MFSCPRYARALGVTTDGVPGLSLLEGPGQAAGPGHAAAGLCVWGVPVDGALVARLGYLMGMAAVIYVQNIVFRTL